MNKIKLVLIISAFIFAAVNGEAQTKTKIGVINVSEVLKLMPEYDSVQVAYQQKYETMQREMQQLYAEFESKQAEFSKNQTNMTEMMKSIKLQELEDLQSRIQSFQEGAQQELNAFVEEKQAPIIVKIKNAIKEVANENGFSHVLNNTQDQVLFFDEAFDILPLVKKKMNLKDKVLPPTGN